MKERPILFSGPMVRALLAGTKTQTRRVVKPDWWRFLDPEDDEDRYHALGRCPYGRAGDRLWVRETLTRIRGNGTRVWYRADGEPTDRGGNLLPTAPGERRWIPAIHVARRESRLTLEITEVRLQRLQDISEDDARAEGVTPPASIGADQPILDTPRRGRTQGSHPHVLAFAVLWDTINADRGFPWVSNPWVWCVSFGVVNARGVR